MNYESLWIIISTLIGIIIPATFSIFWYTRMKKKELEQQMLFKKMIYYEKLLSSYHSMIHNPGKKSTAMFIEQYYLSSLYGSKQVLEACTKILDNIREFPHGNDNQPGLFTKLFNTIRNDIQKIDEQVNVSSLRSVNQ